MKNALIIILLLINAHVAYIAHKYYKKSKAQESQLLDATVKSDDKLYDYQLKTYQSGYSLYSNGKFIDSFSWNEKFPLDNAIIADNL